MDPQDSILNITDKLALLELPANVQSTTLLVILLCVLIVISFSIAGTQAAIFSLDDKDVDVLKTKQQVSSKRILALLEEPKSVYVSMLIAKTFCNICIIVLANYLINQYIPPEYLSSEWAIALKFLAIAFVLLFLVEIFPRVWASQNNLRFALEWSILILFVEGIHLFLRRISKWIVSIADSIGRGVGANKADETSYHQLDEAIDIQTNDDTSPVEKDIIKGIVKFGKISVKKAMRSRLYVSGIEYKTTYNELIEIIKELQYSRLPVYKENLDNIVGILNTKELVPFLYENNVSEYEWHSKIRPPYFIPESKLIEDLLVDFQKKRIHFAVVVDEFGGTSGIVTMEDIMDEVVGDIKDEFDQDEISIRKIEDNTFVFEGRTMLNDVCKAMKIPFDTFDKVRGENESIGGLVVELSGELPENNAVVRSGDFEFTVLETEKNRVKSVKVSINRE